MDDREQKDKKFELPEIPSFFRVEVGRGKKKAPTIETTGSLVQEAGESNDLRRKKIILLGLIFLLASIALIFIFLRSSTGEKFSSVFQRSDRQVVNDELYLPKINSVSGVDGRMVGQQKTASPINKESGSTLVVVPQAKLTVKESYDLSKGSVLKWSTDAKLVYIKSLGTVTAEGRSSEWQLVFGSASRQAGYEIIVWVDKVVSEREVSSIFSGYDLPKNWFDSSAAVESLRTSIDFSTSTLSAINFFYNEDSKDWVYGLQTSRGGTSMHLQ